MSKADPFSTQKMFRKNSKHKYKRLEESPSPPPPLLPKNSHIQQKPPERPPKPPEKNLIDFSDKTIKKKK